MALSISSIDNNSSYAILEEAADSPGYTDAIRRDTFEKTSVHCPTASVTVQISLVQEPDVASDVDWYDVPESGNFVLVDIPTRWLRVKGIGEEDKVYILSETFGME